jgi:hypothetical protein
MPAQVDYKFSEDTTGLLSLRRRPSHRKRGYLHSYMQQRSMIIVTFREAAASIEALIRSMDVKADEAIRIWSRATEMTSKLVKHYGKRLFLCEYEALRHDPQAEIRSILAFLGLPPDTATEEYLERYGDVGASTDRDTAPEKLRLSELSPKAFAMYNGICSFRMDRSSHESDYSDANSGDFDASEFLDSDDATDDFDD